MSRKLLSVLLLLLLALPLTALAQDDEGDSEEPSIFHLRGTKVMQIGEYPHSFSYDGTNAVLTGLPGFFELHINADEDNGIMFARFYVEDYQLDKDTLLEGEHQITVIYPLFGGEVMPDYWEGGIADQVLLHGDSGQEAPVLPTVYNEVASWGPALVFVDGEQIQISDKPLGAQAGHMMYSNEVRDPETGFVAGASPDEPYNPMAPSEAQPYDEEAVLLHLVVHTEERDPDAFPPFTSFIHFNFLEVEEIEPTDAVMELPILTFEDAAEMSDEEVQEYIDTVMSVIDSIEEELNAMEMESEESSDS
ncbi:MAG: hypothetical protein D6712_09910 [Chloroflexi bacterium]|nr:MAG: hypothetical protein D6712_09910 [Chloroflexota bacterium]